MARLVVINRPPNATTHELAEGWTTIGRADGNLFQLSEPSVSGRHCEVCPKGETLLVRDLLSTNGTFINNQRVGEGTVQPGQLLRLGDVELRFEPSPARPAPGGLFNSKRLITDSTSAPPPSVVPIVEKQPMPKAVSPGKKHRVLFVDDSMAFLETFGGLCIELADGRWQVITAVSADRALAILHEGPVDLVVLDIAMPMLDGLQLLGIIGRRYPGVKIAVMTALATDNNRSDALAKGAELFLEKPVTPEGMKMVFNVLDDLVSWHSEGFTGALRHVSLPEIIQVECNGRHSSILDIRNPEMHGEIHIEAGIITHAVVGTLQGEEAFYRLLGLKGGEFQIKPFKAPPQRTIDNRWEFLLMEAARVRDEEIAGHKPANDIKAAPSTNAPGVDNDFVIVATYDGRWIPTDNPPKDK